MARKKSAESIESTIFARVKRWGRGCVVLPIHFLDLGSRQAVGVALHRLAKAKSIRRLSRGVYDYPVIDPLLGQLSPSIDAITKALTQRDRIRLQPSGGYALNLLGLSEQVPARIVFLTEGPSRAIKIGPRTILLRRTTPRNMATAGQLSGLVIQAFRTLGKKHVTPARIEKLRSTIPLKQRQELLRDIALAPAWMHPLLYDLAESRSGGKQR
ncbi:MAG: DUF6088 family protein [Planctomycetota bacterium]